MGSKKSRRRKPAVRCARRPPSKPTTFPLSPSAVSSPTVPTSTTGMVDVAGGITSPPAPDAREGGADWAEAAANSWPPPPPVADGCTSSFTPTAVPRPGPPPCLLLSSSPRCPSSGHISPPADLPALASSGLPRPSSSEPQSAPPAGGGLWAAMSPLGGSTPRSASSGLGPSPEGLIPFSYVQRASPPPIHPDPAPLAVSRPRPPPAVGGGPLATLSPLGVSESGSAPAGSGPPPEGVPHPFPALRPSPSSAEPGVRASEGGSFPSGASPSGVCVQPPLASPASLLAARGSPSPLPAPSGTGAAPPSISFPSGTSPSGVCVQPPLASPVSLLAARGSPSPLPAPSRTGAAPPSISFPSGTSPSGVCVQPPLASPVSLLASRGSPSPLLAPSGTGAAPPAILSQLVGPTSSLLSPASSERHSRRAADLFPYGRPGVRSQRPQAPSPHGVTRPHDPSALQSMQPSMADVVASFVRPPRSELGAQLKAPPLEPRPDNPT